MMHHFAVKIVHDGQVRGIILHSKEDCAPVVTVTKVCDECLKIGVSRPIHDGDDHGATSLLKGRNL